MVSALDDGVGAIIETLKKDGVYNDTLVIFLSDNGCPGYLHGACSNAPLSGYKRWLAEGGIRVPYIVSWPGHLPAHRIDHRQVSSLDILPTAAALAHAKLPMDRVYDGVDLLPFLDGDDEGVPNPKLYWRDGVDFAMRDADSKLWICDIAPRETTSPEPTSSEALQGRRARQVVPAVGPNGRHVMLYDLAGDVGESHDIAAVRPSEVVHLEAQIASWNETLVRPQWAASKHSTIDFDGQSLELFY
jgi:hypothetical protein